MSNNHIENPPELHRQRHTIIFVTHEEPVTENAHRIILVRDGLIESDLRIDRHASVVTI